MPKEKKQPSATHDKIMPASEPDDPRSQLMAWAHKGDEDSVKRISDFIAKEKDNDMREFAQMAYDEAEYSYYSPNNEKEEQEFLLAKMIHERDERLWGLISKADVAKFELQKLDLDRRVHRKIISNAAKNKKTGILEEWQYCFSEDYYKTVQNRLQEFENDISYESAWLSRAREMITAKRYQKIPAEIWEHIHWDGEGGTFWIDSDEDDDDGYCCECCACAQCPHCGSYDTAPIDDEMLNAEEAPF